jgi:hypothetical protein|tara:strand:- start:520 stop:1050 length:531 start_codon:yes stop_codon:yes gene_type:complete
MKNVKLFSVEVAPAMVLLDLEGKRHPVATADQAGEALRVANELHGLGGKALTRGYAGSTVDVPHDSILLFYTSAYGRPTKTEINQAAQAIAFSRVELSHDDCEDGSDPRITGGRAVVYAERATVKNGSVPFLVSTRIWYNRNRSTVNFPYSENECALALEDINARLRGSGTVSLAR